MTPERLRKGSGELRMPLGQRVVARRCGKPSLGEQDADCVEQDERGEYQECVEGDLRLSATDFALRSMSAMTRLPSSRNRINGPRRGRSRA